MPAVDPAQALADLTEISSHVKAAALLEPSGRVLASTLADEEQGEAFARSAYALLAAADEADGSGGPVQLQAELPDGYVFVVRDDAGVAAAVTATGAPVGLVFYDLKMCLRRVGEDEGAKRRLRRGAREAGDATE